MKKKRRMRKRTRKRRRLEGEEAEEWAIGQWKMSKGIKRTCNTRSRRQNGREKHDGRKDKRGRRKGWKSKNKRKLLETGEESEHIKKIRRNQQHKTIAGNEEKRWKRR